MAEQFVSMPARLLRAANIFVRRDSKIQDDPCGRLCIRYGANGLYWELVATDAYRLFHAWEGDEPSEVSVAVIEQDELVKALAPKANSVHLYLPGEPDLCDRITATVQNNKGYEIDRKDVRLFHAKAYPNVEAFGVKDDDLDPYASAYFTVDRRFLSDVCKAANIVSKNTPMTCSFKKHHTSRFGSNADIPVPLFEFHDRYEPWRARCLVMPCR